MLPDRRGAALGSAALACATLALAGCSSTGSKQPRATRELPPAPEPAVAPALTVAPAGVVIALGGGEPEGVVADATTATVAVALRKPNKLALVDTRTGRLTRLVDVPGAARHLQLAGPGGPVLVPGEDTDLLSAVALPGGTVLATTKVGRQPHDAAPAAGRVVVADELGSSVSVVENAAAGNSSVLRRFPGPVQPGGVGAVGARVGVVDVRGALLYVYDAATVTSLGTLPAGDGPTHAVPDGAGRLVVADTRGDALLTYDLGGASGPPRQLRRQPVPGKPYGLAVDATRHQLWVALSATNVLVRFRVDAAGLTELARFPTVRQPNSLAVDESTGVVYVAGGTDGDLQILTPPAA